MVAYKLFKLKKGKLYPLYVLSSTETPIGVWLKAKSGELTIDGKVKSKLGPLQYRPGWHLSDIPLATHIGIKEDGVIRYMHDDEVWCECEYSDEVDYQEEAKRNGIVKEHFNSKKAMLSHIPENGFYRFKTNPLMLVEWIIAGSIKVNRILLDEEVSSICREKGYEALPRSPRYKCEEIKRI